MAMDATVTTVKDEQSRTKVVAVARATVRSRRGVRMGCGHGGGEESGVGHDESPGIRTSIEGWDAAIEGSGMCMRLVTSSLRSGRFFLRQSGSIRYL
jgi:hypothetical protein